MYGGTLTVGDNEVCYGDIMFVKTDSFEVPLPDMFSFVGTWGNNLLCAENNTIMSSFPFIKKAKRK